MTYRVLSYADDVENSQYQHASKPNGYNSWKKYWEDKSVKRWPEKCSHRGCKRNAVRSGHVIVNHDENSENIIPTCEDHKSPTFSEIFSVDPDTVAVDIGEEEIMTELVENLADNVCVLPLSAGDKVKNVVGTGQDKARDYLSWKKFYKANGRREWPNTCCVSNCKEPADGGAHVHIKRVRGVFIVPMCTKLHNTAQNMKWESVKKNTIAVRVYRDDTRRINDHAILMEDIPLRVNWENTRRTNDHANAMPGITPPAYRDDTRRSNDHVIPVRQREIEKTTNNDSGWLSWCSIL